MTDHIILVYVYLLKDHPEQKELIASLDEFSNEFPHKINLINIENDKFLLDSYGDKVPVVDIGPYRLFSPIKEEEIRFAFLETSRKIQVATERESNLVIDRFTKPPQITRSNRFSFWFSKHYMFLFNLAVLLYVGFAFMAPVLLKIGAIDAAKTIYTLYKPLCHQLAFRSFFIFGDQVVYPRESAHVDDLLTYGEVSGLDENDIILARDFNGNERLGFKVALCQRDIAIYLSIFIFGMIFSISGRKIKPIPWYIWLILGIGPIGLDGFSQLLSQTGYAIFNWLPYRESTPILRVITGGLFGLFTAWYGYPFVEESVEESRLQLLNKFAIVHQLIQKQGNKD
jgi:uncharacterized membrane protein